MNPTILPAYCLEKFSRIWNRKDKFSWSSIVPELIRGGAESLRRPKRLERAGVRSGRKRAAYRALGVHRWFPTSL